MRRLRRILLTRWRGFPGGGREIAFCAAVSEREGKNQKERKASHFNFSCQYATCSRTRAGAVPPKLDREATEDSSDNNA